MIELVGFVTAMNHTLEEAYSARPDAPVVPTRERVQGRGDPFRRGTAVLLRRIADRVEPRRTRPCSTAAV
ncbi:hypothetical protein [Asanoa sp. NPDC050611]|uniref:hypothetical protein n=1 Tax=Asanoa sp. NPDC050611 TaxID=3157098 RepID=UPI0033C93040